MEPTPYSSFSPSTFVKATPGQRFVALLIDVIVVAIPVALLVAISPGLRVLAQLLAIVYMATRDTLPYFNGQSFGKKAMNIKVVSGVTGTGIMGDYGAGVIRYISQIIPLFNIVDALMVFSSDGKRFGDKWAKTTVVKA
ncbi:RDD family protein [Fibrella aquatica]|uniref:RDD family protein n=1 Tax=Fibrella aquatica TaxID=3242487 RepID=UPI00352062DD